MEWEAYPIQASDFSYLLGLAHAFGYLNGGHNVEDQESRWDHQVNDCDGQSRTKIQVVAWYSKSNIKCNHAEHNYEERNFQAIQKRVDLDRRIANYLVPVNMNKLI